MAGGKVENDPATLAKNCELFMTGAKRKYDADDCGDMWLFELYHHLEDCKSALRREEIGKFKPLISLGFDKNGEADFRINMSIAELDRPKMDELCRMMPWTIKEALTLWLDHGPPSKEMAQQCAAEPIRVTDDGKRV